MWPLRVSHIFHELLKISPHGEEGAARESIHKKPHQCLHKEIIILQIRANLPLLIWTRGKFGITLPIFWSLEILHISESENSQALPSYKITNIPPTLNPEALRGTTAAEFTQHQKSTSISSAKTNKIQNKATNINSTCTVSPWLREQVIAL